MNGILIGLCVVFSASSVLVFSLFIHRYTQVADLQREQAQLEQRKPALNMQISRLDDRLKPVAGVSGKQLPAAALYIDSVQASLKALEDKLKQNRDDYDRIAQEAQVSRKAAEEIRTEGNALVVKVLADMQSHREEIAKEEEKFHELVAANDKQRREKEEQVRKAARQVEVVRKEGRDRLVVLDARVAELDARLLQIRNQRTASNLAMEPDGKVMVSVSDQGYVIIDRGLKNQLRMNTEFTVFTKRGSANVVKGRIKVIRVDEDKATARVITEERSNDPILDGDLIYNPIYDPTKVNRFLVTGTFKRYSKDELELFVTSNGGALGTNLGTDVDFLVAGDESDAATEQAVRLGISVLGENQLIEFLRPADATTTIR